MKQEKKDTLNYSKTLVTLKSAQVRILATI
jgi:hypothetical protein